MNTCTSVRSLVIAAVVTVFSSASLHAEPPEQRMGCKTAADAREIERKAAAKETGFQDFVKAKIASGDCVVVEGNAPQPAGPVAEGNSPQPAMPAALFWVAKEATRSIITEMASYMLELIRDGASAAWRWAFG
jgi:hypothetical protein